MDEQEPKPNQPAPQEHEPMTLEAIHGRLCDRLSTRGKPRIKPPDALYATVNVRGQDWELSNFHDADNMRAEGLEPPYRELLYHHQSFLDLSRQGERYSYLIINPNDVIPGSLLDELHLQPAGGRTLEQHVTTPQPSTLVIRMDTHQPEITAEIITPTDDDPVLEAARQSA